MGEVVEAVVAAVAAKTSREAARFGGGDANPV